MIKGENIMKNSIRKDYLLLAILFVSIFALGFGQPAQAQETGGTMKIKLYFPKDDPEANLSLVAVERTVKRTRRVAETTVRELLKGVSESERKMGLTSAYAVENLVTGREECAREKMKPLAAYFLGVSIKRGTAIVNFRPEAECYLQSTVTMMSFVMEPIDATLKQFSSIKEVQYALDGKVITEWDA
jgi:spore germination protein GerM